MRNIEKIILHCTDSPDDLDIGRTQIDQWHKERGWSGIGYHFVVRRNGRIEIGRPLGVVGAHARGENQRSIGIVWVGRKTPTQAQYKALLDLTAGLMKEYKLPFDSIVGHFEVDSKKTCPNLDMNRVRAEILFIDIIPKEIKDAISMAS